MSLENKKWLGLSLVAIIGLTLFSLKPGCRAVRPVGVHQTRASKTLNDRAVSRSKRQNFSEDFIVEDDSESSKLYKDFVSTGKRMALSDDSGRLGMRSDDSRYRRKLSSVDFSPVLNM